MIQREKPVQHFGCMLHFMLEIFLEKKRNTSGLVAVRYTDLITHFLLDEVHLVDQAEDLRSWRVLHQRFQARLVVSVVLVDLTAFHVEDVYQYLQWARCLNGTRVSPCLDVFEDLVPLRCHVVLHELLLTTAVPYVKHHVAQEPKHVVVSESK